MSLSLMYIALIVCTAVVGLILIATFISKDHYIGICISILFMGIGIVSLYNIGIKYGEYGLEIIIGKAFQRKHIQNDFPRIENQLLLDQQLFPHQTLIKQKDSKNQKQTKNNK